MWLCQHGLFTAYAIMVICRAVVFVLKIDKMFVVLLYYGMLNAIDRVTVVFQMFVLVFLTACFLPLLSWRQQPC
jgi:hypothetical protein